MGSVSPRLLLATAGIAAMVTVFACDSHSTRDGVRVDAQAACVSCHLGDFEDPTTVITHSAQTPTPTTECRLCHSTEKWRPAGLHPDASFPITTAPHQDIRCAECHRAASVGPKSYEPTEYTADNVNCIRCHVRPDMDPAHDTVPDYAWIQTDGDFCRTCHPTGVGAGHPEDEFPIANGAHDKPCVQCHIQILQVGYTEANVSCTASTADGGCHKHAQGPMDDKHQEENGYAYETAACLDCHPRGRN